MTKLERTLLEHILDSLDRLFDRENSLADVHDLLVASHAAMADTVHATTLKESIEKTRFVLRAETSPEGKREKALAATDPLRSYLSRILDGDGTN